MSLFVQKFNEPKRLRSVRLTDTAWDALEHLATQQGLTRTDLLEAWARQPETMTENDDTRASLEAHIEAIVSELVPKRSIKVPPGALVRRCLQELVDRAYPS
jgi:hypothetical protein